MKKTISILTTLLAGITLAVLPASVGQAGSSFTFYGGGYGHGLGMSQWGAYGLARQGWDHRQILTHYYSGTVVRALDGPTSLRIGLIQRASQVTAQALNGPVEIHRGGTGGRLLATIASGDSWTISAGSGGLVIRSAAGAVTSVIATTSTVSLRYRPLASMVRLAQTGHTYNRGSIRIALYLPCSTCAPKARAIAVLAPQGYLFGLGEVPSGWPSEALEAQADAARSYAFNMVARAGQHRSGCDCALYGDARDQVYIGYDKEGGYLGGRWVQAVRATKGEVILSGGAPIPAYYSASSGGYTENNENVWGGTPLPYLRGVCDPGDFTSANPYRTWVVGPLSATTVTAKLRPWTGDIGTVTGFGRIARGVSGRIEQLRVKGTARSETLTGSQLRSALGLRDDRVWINRDKLVRGSIRKTYDGLMCAPGLPISPRVKLAGGARQTFAKGAIYVNAERSLTVWLYGPIQNEYVVTGQASGPLGLPRTGIVALPKAPGCDTQACSRVVFETGRIFSKVSAGTHALFGPVLTFFLNHKGVMGVLGFPTTDVTRRSDGSSAAGFEGGTVTCTAAGACTRSAS